MRFSAPRHAPKKPWQSDVRQRKRGHTNGDVHLPRPTNLFLIFVGLGGFEQIFVFASSGRGLDESGAEQRSAHQLTLIASRFDTWQAKLAKNTRFYLRLNVMGRSRKSGHFARALISWICQ